MTLTAGRPDETDRSAAIDISMPPDIEKRHFSVIATFPENDPQIAIDGDRTTARHAPEQRMISQPTGQWIFGEPVYGVGDGLSFARREPPQWRDELSGVFKVHTLCVGVPR